MQAKYSNVFWGFQKIGYLVGYTLTVPLLEREK